MKIKDTMAQFDAKMARLEQAAVDGSWKGSQPPEEAAGIEKELELARADIRNWVKDHLIDQLENRPHKDMIVGALEKAQEP